MIIVSHDRDFLQGLTDKVYEFKDQKIKMHIGDIYEFLESRNIENLNELNRASTSLSNRRTISPAGGGQGGGGMDYKSAPAKLNRTNPVNTSNVGAKHVSPSSAIQPKSSAEQDRQKKKDQEREQRRRQNQIEKLEAEIEVLEKKKSEMDELLSNPANITNSQIFVDYNKLKEKIDKAMHEWEKLSDL
jgi:ATP-binding cassette subfamily F protein 3